MIQTTQNCACRRWTFDIWALGMCQNQHHRLRLLRLDKLEKKLRAAVCDQHFGNSSYGSEMTREFFA